MSLHTTPNFGLRYHDKFDVDWDDEQNQNWIDLDLLLQNSLDAIVYKAVGQTTDASPTVICTIPLDNDSVYSVETRIIGRNPANGYCAGFWIRTTYKRHGGEGPPLVASHDKISQKDSGATDCTGSASPSGNNIAITVSGIAATTFNWSTVVRLFKIS